VLCFDYVIVQNPLVGSSALLYDCEGMQDVSKLIQEESIASFCSSIRKLEKASAQIHTKSASTVVVDRRLDAFRIGLSALEAAWLGHDFPYAKQQAESAKAVLTGLLPSLRAMQIKLGASKAQSTLLERRVTSLQYAINALQELCETPKSP